jgi:formate hydrogenlyase subunit 3/multisubunit Na+/H+ antiporter MnhD subunit
MLLVIIVSLSHGWGSIGIFSGAGSVSQASRSRLRFLIKAENSLHWFSLLLGVVLVSNASLPPFPSFFCELFLILSLQAMTLVVFVFLFLSLFVCYYNTYIFLQVSHSKRIEKKLGKFCLTELFKFSFLNILAF